MNLTAEQLLDAVLALPDEERLELAEAVIASLQPSDQSPVDDSWREVIRRRSAELRTGQVLGIPWEEVKRRAREKAVA
jgi:putative addiction module component (TIGR02574 family)